jgi:TolB protein
MRFAPFLLFLAACTPASPPAAVPPAAAARLVRGRVTLGDDPLAGARVVGTGGVRRGNAPDLKFDLGAVRSGADGRFELALPEAFLRAAEGRDFWGWYVRLTADHDEFLGCNLVHAEGWERLQDVGLAFERPDPELARTIRDRVESLRSSPLKKHFRYGADPDGGYGEAQEVFNELEEAAADSRSAREVFRRYLKDPDPNLRALAYEILTLRGECEDAPPRPPDPTNPAEARALIEWAFRTVREAKHGGHLTPGVDLDDQCTRCYSLFSDIEIGLWWLPRKEALDVLKKYEGQGGAVGAFHTIARRELRRWGSREDLERERAGIAPDAPTLARPDPSGDWVAVYRFPGILLARPEADAAPVALLPPWLSLNEVAWAGDGKKLMAKGKPALFSQFNLWRVDLEKGLVSRATWGSDDREPRWFPDGRRVLFVRNGRKGQDLWVLDAETFTASLFRPIGQWVDSLSLDASGTKLAYSTREDGPTGLHVLDLSTGQARTIFPGGGGFPVWSRDGTRVAFLWKGRLHLADASGGPAREVAVSDDTAAGLAVSPDGRLALATYAGPFNRARDGRLWVLRDDGGEPRKIVQMERAVSGPEWSPDGSRIAFVALEGPEEKPALYVASDDGQTLVRVLEGADHPRWRPRAR